MYQLYWTGVYVTLGEPPAVMTEQYSQRQLWIWADRTARGLSSMAEPR